MAKSILENSKKGSYSDEYMAQIVAHLLVADSNNVLRYDEVKLIRKALNQAMLRQLERAVRENMDHCARFKFLKESNKGWLECEYTDSKLTLDIDITTDKHGNYWILGGDNIRRVENNDEYRFSIEEIKATQDKFREVANAVFEAFKVQPVEK